LHLTKQHGSRPCVCEPTYSKVSKFCPCLLTL
jgi:hypothetical protein